MSDKKTIEDILNSFLDYQTTGTDKVIHSVDLKYLQVKLQALITEARIDEVKRIDPTSDYVLNDLVMSVGDRLTQLKEKL